MRDRLADLNHRERLAGGRRDDLDQKRLGDLPALDEETHRRDRLAEVGRDVGRRGAGSGKSRRRAQDAEDTKEESSSVVPIHQKMCLTRNSSA